MTIHNMNRQQFNSNNKVGQTFTFQKSGSTPSFTPSITIGGGKRVSYNFGDGTQTAGNNITYTGYTSDNGIRTITVKTNKIKDITALNFFNDNIYGNLNLTGLTSLGGVFSVAINPKLTGITNPISSSVFTNYECWDCNITGNLDLSTLTGLGGNVSLQDNLNLTGVTFPNTNTAFNRLTIYQSNLIGNLNLTGLTNLGGNFGVFTNPNLTGITHAPSSNAFNNYGASNCNLIGNLDLSMLTGLGGSFGVGGNPYLTGITHGPSTEVFANYSASFNGLLGNLDLSMFPNLGGSIQILLNPGLTGITHTATTQNITSYQVNSNNLNGVLDLTPLQNLPSNSSASTSSIRVDSNPSLTNVLLPTNNGYLKNVTNTEFGGALVFYSCSFDYLDFRPYSGVTFLSGVTQGNPRISLRDNNMLASDINHILVDFSGNATYNPTGWSNINLNIGGTNADPDSSSGGYDGLAAVAFLTGSPYNWTITY